MDSSQKLLTASLALSYKSFIKGNLVFNTTSHCFYFSGSSDCHYGFIALVFGVFSGVEVLHLPYQLTAPALALLLVFRTEASYSRFEEERIAETKMNAGANDFASEIISGVENSGDAQLKKALLQYIVAFLLH